LLYNSIAVSVRSAAIGLNLSSKTRAPNIIATSAFLISSIFSTMYWFPIFNTLKLIKKKEIKKKKKKYNYYFIFFIHKAIIYPFWKRQNFTYIKIMIEYNY